MNKITTICAMHMFLLNGCISEPISESYYYNCKELETGVVQLDYQDIGPAELVEPIIGQLFTNGIAVAAVASQKKNMTLEFWFLLTQMIKIT